MSHVRTTETLSLEEATDRIIDYRGRTPPKTDTGVRLITAKVVKGGHILDEPKEFIAADYYGEWMRRGLPEPLDVLVTTEAPLGEVAMLRGQARIALAQRIILLRAKRGCVDPSYLFYALQSEQGQAELKARASGTTVLGIKQSELRKVRIPFVPLPQQQQIGRILSAYDELIENCQRRIQILETMARALYREWFVEFRVPGHDRLDGCEPMHRSPPPHWKVRTLGEVLTLNYGKALKADDRAVGDVPVFGSSGVVGTHDTPLVAGPGIIVGRKGNVGSVFWSDESFYPIDTVYYVTSHLPLRFLYYDLQNKHFLNNDSAVPGLNRGQAYSLEVVVPPDGLLQKFCASADAFESQAAVLRQQIRNLRATRDLLLPRLLSGQLALAETEAALP